MQQFRDTYYYVTQDGRIWSDKSKMFLSPEIGRDGYQRVILHINKKPHMMLLHRIVAECYVPNPDNLPIVNHIDLDKLNCDYRNLEWTTIGGNNKHAIDNGAHRKLSDELNGMSIAVERLENGVWVKYPSSATLARKLGIDRSSITKAIKNGHNVRGCKVRYANS